MNHSDRAEIELGDASASDDTDDNGSENAVAGHEEEDGDGDLNADELSMPQSTVLKDRFGFFVTDTFHKTSLVDAETSQKRVTKEQTRTKKWLRMRKMWSRHFKFNRAKRWMAEQEEGSEAARLSISIGLANGSAEGGSATSADPESILALQRQSIQSTSLVISNEREDYDSLGKPIASAVLKRRVRKGIPDCLRASVWYDFVDAERVRRAYPNPDRDIDVSVLSQQVREEIDRDIDRTFPRHAMFIEKEGNGQLSLRRVLRWYAALDPEVAYCQGMGFVAALFLTYMPEDQAFYVFYACLTRLSCPLRTMYLPRLVEMQVMLSVMDTLGAQHLPLLWTHFANEGIHVTMFFTEWAMAFFCRGFSFELVTRFFDVLLFEGRLKMVYRLSLAILRAVQAEILTLRFDKIMSLLRDLPNRIDSLAVVDDCWSLPLKTEHIVAAERKYWSSKAAGRGI